jgi:hypothetical protein
MCICTSKTTVHCDRFEPPANVCRFCENGGLCVERKRTQSDWKFTCLCPRCHYGSICQFNTEQYSVSFDALMYEINMDKLIIVLLTVFLVFGSVVNGLSIATFCQLKARKMGSGVYLLWASIIGEFCLITVTLRLLLIVINQNGYFSCFGLEYCISVLPAFCDSLTACVAVERAVVIYKRTLFNKKLSVKVAKYLVGILALFHMLFALHEPFHRHVLPDPVSPERFWCTLAFPDGFWTVYEKATNVGSIVLSFTVNFVSTTYVFIHIARSKATMGTQLYFWSALLEHKHYVISPLLLMLFNAPRLVFTFAFACITELWQNTAYLVAYLISYLPLMTTLFIFILPSSTYKQELKECIRKTRRWIKSS